MRRHRRSPEQGNALMVTMIALAVLMVLVVGSIRFTGTNKDAAIAKSRGAQLSACAETARRYLLSKLRIFKDIQALNLVNEKLLDDVDPSKRSTMSQVHYDGTPGVRTIKVVDSGAFGQANQQVREISNKPGVSVTQGGEYYRVVVTCSESSGRQSELEFVFRYGL